MGKEYETEEVIIKANDDGMINIVELWQLREMDDLDDPNKFFEEAGTIRFISHMKHNLKMDEKEIAWVDNTNKACWVHPLVMFKYMAWCEPNLMIQMVDLYDDYCKHKMAKINEGKTRH